MDALITFVMMMMMMMMMMMATSRTLSTTGEKHCRDNSYDNNTVEIITTITRKISLFFIEDVYCPFTVVSHTVCAVEPRRDVTHGDDVQCQLLAGNSGPGRLDRKLHRFWIAAHIRRNPLAGTHLRAAASERKKRR